ncbi:DUF6384 family protein [Hyphomonas sp. FCG-A18]|uniref:DUF6384 family protein n=1 Tax=Hyphomonas sp. FCG-A18 TaxID=3080019 RepID=UPI002B2FAE58|nr:DUF6384 family protein [Hyphomonas sp. FCG-A18]
MNAPTVHKKPLDEVLVAMDVVDTLRHRDQALLKELDRTGRKADLIKRLREIYEAQGIEVPDHVIEQGVKALEEQRFRYIPPKDSFSVRLAKIYVSRSRWWKPVVGGIAAIGVALSVYQFGYVGPQNARAEATQIALTETLPRELAEARQAALEVSEDADADRMAESLYQTGLEAVQGGRVTNARQAVEGLEQLETDLSAVYDVRVVYGPNEPRSGVFRLNDAAAQVTNYYLIVEAVSPGGELVTVPITSEEDRTTKRVTRWGQRVSEAAFDEIAADKQDDLIIQNAVIGQKARGQLSPEFRVTTPGGAILEW